MKKQNLLTLAACVFITGSPLVQLRAQTDASAPATPEAPKVEEKAVGTVDADKTKWTAVRKQAGEDPKVKAAMDAAAEAKRQATLKMYEKMREIDPSLAAQIEKEEARLKPKEPKPDAANKTAAGKPDAAKPAMAKKAAPDATAKDKSATTTAKPAADKPATQKKPAATDPNAAGTKPTS